VRLFIASTDKTLRLALLMLLENEPAMVVIGMSDRREGLLTVVCASQPEVVLLDDGLAKQATGRLVDDLHRLECQPKVIVLSIDPQRKAAILAAGADGFVGKSAPPDELLPLLRRMRLSGGPPHPLENSPM
jgi:DNA-binding NarL/FixJ family response regulator